ncbi:hypothetical protein C8A03DRAFT_44757 [Achaetomium macrosporum]|uniref:RNA-binding protein n=1 Tax=Achaetomium macrosporum TaxID=79813 RepID=A0AAN7HBG7_9PEZI|nr:hypothetical protein C8A03DRAFT_44757 [Achaetomium macrosporum]
MAVVGQSLHDRDRDRHRRSRSPYARRSDDRDGDYRRSRKDSPGRPRNLKGDDYDDSGGAGSGDHPSGTGKPKNSTGLDRRYTDPDTVIHHAGSRWNGGGPSSNGGCGPVSGLRTGARGISYDESTPDDEAHRHHPVHGAADSADYHNRDAFYPDASRFAHTALAGYGDQPHFRSSGRSGTSVADNLGYANPRDPRGRHLQRVGGPGRAVVLDGLPDDVTERDILYGLDYVTRDRRFSSDRVRVARVRYDHNGRCIAFVEFHRRSDAEYFYDRYYPDISFRLEHSRGRSSDPVTVGISYPRSDESRSSRESRNGDDDGWDCIKCGAINYPHRAVCFKCKAERPEDDHGPVLTGETDECPQQTPSQYVVVRDLEGSVTEEVLAKGVMKLFVENSEPTKEAPTTANKLKSTAPTNSTVGLGAKPGSLRRVFLMRDRKTNSSWRYGFAEFASVEDAKAAVAKFRASTKFTIASKPVVIAFIHTGVFIPAFDGPETENQEFSFTPIYNPAVRVKYWDERAYPSVHVVSTEPLPDAASPEKAGGNEDAKSGPRPSKKAKTTKEPVPAAKIAMMPQMQLWAKASAELHGAKPAADADISSAQAPDEVKSAAARVASREAEDAQPDGPVAPQQADQYLSYADWDTMTCLACGWEAPNQPHIQERGWPQTRGDLLIEHEGRAHNFFKEDNAIKEKAAAALSALSKEPRPIVRRIPRLKSERLPVYKSYADFDRLRCVLCKRVFKDIRLIWLHEQQSELHKRMLADPQNRLRAAEEFRKLGKKMRVLEPDAEFKKRWEVQRVRFVQPQYRDRALERRKVFGQPRKPTVAAGPGGSATVPEKRKEPAEPADKDKEPVTKKSKGAGMLAKMGWTAGVGLGAEGAGRTEAIATEVYAPGVGLGAEGGKLGDASEEAARKTRGDFAAFVQKTKERARERFERM